MNFKFLNFNDSICNNCTYKNDDIVVFSDYFLKDRYEKKYLHEHFDLFSSKKKILTLEEFSNLIFFTDKIILREAKRIITLFHSLNEANRSEIKEKFHIEIDNYFDFIPLGNEFFKFFKEKKKNLISDYHSLTTWQEKKIELFQYMFLHYDNYLNEKNYIPFDFIEDEKNIDLSLLKEYSSITFVDTMNFSPLFKEALKRIESEGITVNFILQIPEESFSRDTLEILEVNLPELPPNCNIYRIKEEKEAIFSVKKILEERKRNSLNSEVVNIFTPNLRDSKFSKILPRDFKSSNLDLMDNTNLYHFFNGLKDLLESREEKLKSISLIELEKVITLQGFAKNYNLTKDDIRYIRKIIDSDYKYLNSDLLSREEFLYYFNEDTNEKLLKIYQDLEELATYKSVSQFFTFFKNKLNLSLIIDLEYKDILEKFYEALSLAEGSEKLYSTGFNEIFQSATPTSILKLIIKYMNGLELQRIEEIEKEYLALIRDIKVSKENQNNYIIFSDINSNYIPKILDNNSLFTEAQKEWNGITTNETLRKIEKYRFIQSVFSSKECALFFCENLNDGVGISPFLLEISEKYNISILDAPITNLDMREYILSSLVNINDLEKIEGEEKRNTLPIKNIEDFTNSVISLNGYSSETFINCQYQYLFSDLFHIEGEVSEFKNKLSMRYLGNFGHKIIENISRKLFKRIVENSDFSVEEKEISDECFSILKDDKYKVPTYLIDYVKLVIIPLLSKNIKKYFEKLEKEYMNDKILKLTPEKSSKSREVFLKEKFLYGGIVHEISVFLRGRVDLLIESEISKKIVDFKTGNGKYEQLEFYSIMLFGDETLAKKEIYNLITGETQDYKSENPKITVENLKSNIKNFFSEIEYSLAEKKSYCTYCNYSKICRRELK